MDRIPSCESCGLCKGQLVGQRLGKFLSAISADAQTASREGDALCIYIVFFKMIFTASFLTCL